MHPPLNFTILEGGNEVNVEARDGVESINQRKHPLSSQPHLKRRTSQPTSDEDPGIIRKLRENENEKIKWETW